MFRSSLAPAYRRLATTSTAMDTKTSLVISALDAKDLFISSPKSTKLLDATWFMPTVPRDPKVEFANRRLSTAKFWDLDEIASTHPLGLKHMIPSGEQFRAACSELGIQRNHHVLLYDSQGVFSSPRALFTFRIFGHERSSVINGGLPACESSGFPMEEGPPKNPLGSQEELYPKVEIDSARIRDYAQIVANASKSPDSSTDVELVLDARPRGRWAGTDPEPRPNMRSGHIPHSLSVPFNILLENNHIPGKDIRYTTLLESQKLWEVLKDSLGDEYLIQILNGRRPVVSSCGSGMSAAIIWLALRVLGTESAIYDESWSGYAVREESRIETI